MVDWLLALSPWWYVGTVGLLSLTALSFPLFLWLRYRSVASGLTLPLLGYNFLALCGTLLLAGEFLTSEVTTHLMEVLTWSPQPGNVIFLRTLLLVLWIILHYLALIKVYDKLLNSLRAFHASLLELPFRAHPVKQLMARRYGLTLLRWARLEL